MHLELSRNFELQCNDVLVSVDLEVYDRHLV